MPTQNAQFYLGDTQYLFSSWPVGSLMQYVGDVAPDGWALCQGQSLLQADYPSLYALIGTKFGSAAAGYFKLPDLRGAFIRGAGTNGSTGWAGGIVGASGGSMSVTLSTSHLPSHTHTFSGTSSTHTGHQHAQSGSFSIAGGSTSTDGSHGHSASIASAVTNSNTAGGGSLQRVSSLTYIAQGLGAAGSHSHSVSGSVTISGNTALSGSHSHTYSGTTAGAGSGSAFDTTPGYVALNHIIRLSA